MRLFFADRRITPEQSHYFDAWRGGSAIVVLIGHAAPLYFEGERIFSAMAGAAVMAFFALSGFFIHKSLVKSSRTGVFDWRSYLEARANRILPTFVFALLLTWACWAVAPAVFQSGSRAFLNPTVREAISLDGFWRTAFFLNGFAGPTVSANGPLWSLTYEVWFYFGAAILAACLTGTRWAWLILAVFPLLLLADPMFGVWTMCWASGFVVSILHANGLLKWRLGTASFVAGFAPAIAMVGVAAAPPALAYWAGLVFALMFGMWFALHMAHALTVQTLPVANVLSASAAWSYTLYVIHFPLLLVAYGMSEAKALAPVACIAILMLARTIGPHIEAVKIIRLPVAQPVRAHLPKSGPSALIRLGAVVRHATGRMKPAIQPRDNQRAELQ